MISLLSSRQAITSSRASNIIAPRDQPTMSLSGTYTCGVCKKQMSCYTEGTHTKETIRVVLPWMNKTATVVQNGEQRLPCPDCERPRGLAPQEDFHITSWDNISTRLHCRVRQHYVRHHNYRLNEIYDLGGVAKYYDDARRLRCELIHGPRPPGTLANTSVSESTSAAASVPTSEPQPSTSVNQTATSNFIFPPGAEENLDDQPPSIQSAHARMKTISGLKDNASIPDGENYMTWLRKETELADSTIGSYLVVTRNFLGWLLNHKTTDIGLKHAWNIDWVKAFMQAVRETNPAPTTMYNYACALSTIQKFLINKGECEPTERDKSQWTGIMRYWSRKKKNHQKKVSQVKLENTPGLDELQNRIIDSTSAREKFNELVQYCRLEQTVKPSDFKWATGYAILQLQSSNFKRNGNLSKIKVTYAMDRLKEALQKVKASKGKKRISCTFEVNDATKTGGKEIFAMIDPVKIRTLYDYCKYVRPNCPAKVKDDDLFINTIGTGLKSKVSDVIQTTARAEGLAGLVIRDMRTRVETRAAAHPDQVDRKEIASHLAHSEKTRDRHYLLPTTKRSKRAAADLENLLQQHSSSSDNTKKKKLGKDPDPYDLEEEEKRQRILRKRTRDEITFENLTSESENDPPPRHRPRLHQDDSDKDPTFSPKLERQREEWESPPSDSEDDERYDADGEESRQMIVQISSSSSRGSSVIFVEKRKITTSFAKKEPAYHAASMPSSPNPSSSKCDPRNSRSSRSSSETEAIKQNCQYWQSPSPIHSPSDESSPPSSPVAADVDDKSPAVPSSLLTSEDEISPLPLKDLATLAGTSAGGEGPSSLPSPLPSPSPSPSPSPPPLPRTLRSKGRGRGCGRGKLLAPGSPEAPPPQASTPGSEEEETTHRVATRTLRSRAIPPPPVNIGHGKLPPNSEEKTIVRKVGRPPKRGRGRGRAL